MPAGEQFAQKSDILFIVGGKYYMTTVFNAEQMFCLNSFKVVINNLFSIFLLSKNVLYEICDIKQTPNTRLI